MSQRYTSASTPNGHMTFMEVYSLCKNSYRDLRVGQELTGTGNTWVVEQTWSNGGFAAFKIRKVGDWHAIVFRGSNKEADDWVLNNLTSFLGMSNPPQYVSGADVVNNYGAGKILVGHSLGGGIATYAAALAANNGRTIPAVTIFPAPVIPDRLPGGGAGAYVTNYVCDGEILTELSKADRGGNLLRQIGQDVVQDLLNGPLPGARHRRLGVDFKVDSRGGGAVAKHELDNIIV